MRLSTGAVPKMAWEVNLEEKELKEIPCDGSIIEFTINPYEIKTFRIEYYF